MASDDLLTKDEMDALLESVVSVNSRGIDNEFETEATPYELASPENAVAGILPLLENIHERFVHRFRIGLFEMLRREIDVATGAVATCSYRDISASLASHCSINMVSAAPLTGTGLLLIEQPLVFVLVDTFFGGKGRRYADSEAREFSAAESRMTQRIVQLALNCLEAAWQPFVKVVCRHLGSESNPQFVTAINPEERLLSANVTIELDGNTGTVRLAFPCSAFEPVREPLLASLSKPHAAPNERLTKLLRDGVKGSRVAVRAFLAETELTIRELLLLKAGDVVPLEIPPTAVLEAEGVPIYSGPYGIARGCRALKITQALTPLEGDGPPLTDEDIKQ